MTLIEQPFISINYMRIIWNHISEAVNLTKEEGGNDIATYGERGASGNAVVRERAGMFC